MPLKCFASIAPTARTSSRISARPTRISASLKSSTSGLTIYKKFPLIAFVMCFTTLSSSKAMPSNSPTSQISWQTEESEVQPGQPRSRPTVSRELYMGTLSRLPAHWTTKRVQVPPRSWATKARQVWLARIRLLFSRHRLSLQRARLSSLITSLTCQRFPLPSLILWSPVKIPSTLLCSI